MQVSVVVPTYRRPHLLARCLASLLRQTWPQDQYEIIVADDANDDRTRHLVESLDSRGVRLRCIAVTENHGPAAARNVGWRAAGGSIIAFTDDDCIPDGEWLAAGIAPFDDPAVVSVTGRTVVPLPPEPTDFERNTAGLEASEFITANCFCRRQALTALGGFDEAFQLAWREDSDLHFRLLNTGGRIVRAERALVVHPTRPAPWGISLREQRKAMFDALLFRKHPGHFRRRILPGWPWRYYVAVFALAAAVAAAAAGQHLAAAGGVATWCGFTAALIRGRLRSTNRSSWHVAEMVLTSLAIPPLSVFWRIYGGLRFRTLFW